MFRLFCDVESNISGRNIPHESLCEMGGRFVSVLYSCLEGFSESLLFYVQSVGRSAQYSTLGSKFNII